MYTNPRLPSYIASAADRPAALLIAIALLACPPWTLRAGEIYKSVDAQGHVVYSDHLDASMAQPVTVQIQSSEAVADIDVRASESPPPLPDNEQPPCPDEGYLWTPGYWYWNTAGYYWIPGAWVQPPQLDVLWTPGYWEFVDAGYVFHRGYWAEHVGYYGGINYGFGYFGVGFAGGRWLNHIFAYNRTVSNVDARRFHSTYSEAVNKTGAINRVSYNGGPGGTATVMTAREKAPRAAQMPALMPRMPISVYHVERGAADRNTEAAQKPTALNASATAGSRVTSTPSLARQHELTRAPPTSRASTQATVAHPTKPVAAHPASSKAMSVMPYPKG
jgi:Domain of unknown function (DUF4124)/WXXGXW repeat (2 copies)